MTARQTHNSKTVDIYLNTPIFGSVLISSLADVVELTRNGKYEFRKVEDSKLQQVDFMMFRWDCVKTNEFESAIDLKGSTLLPTGS